MDETTVLSAMINCPDGTLTATVNCSNASVGLKPTSDRSISEPVGMFLAGVIGNSIALILLIKSLTKYRKSGKKGSTSIFKLMAALTCTDLLGTCATSPVVIAVYSGQLKLRQGSALCHYFSFMLLMANFSTMSLVLAMAIDRYICTCHPLVYRHRLPSSFTRYAIGIAWLFSFFMASLPLVGLGHNVLRFPYTWCFFDSYSRQPTDAVFNYIYIIIGVLNITIAFYCNISTIIYLLTQRRQRKRMTERGAYQSRSMSERITQFQMMAISCGVAVIYTACYGPLMITTILFRTALIDQLNPDILTLRVIRIASYNQICDPWFYILLRRDLRWIGISFFKRIFGWLRGLSNKGGGRPMVATSRGTNSVVALDKGRQGQGQVMYASNISMNRLNDLDSGISCRSFCFHCLCDPPTYTDVRNPQRVGMQSQSRSRAMSTESAAYLGPPQCVLRQPSCMDKMELEIQNGTKV